MKYFKNVELAKLYGISEGTVRRWIRQTLAGELNLDLYEHNGVTHVSNSSQNQKLIEDLVKKGKKYTNSRWNKVITPKPEFYKTYNDKHIADMITNLQMYREIPLQYVYFKEGTKFWDAYSRKHINAGGINMFTAAIQLMHTNFGNIDRIIGDRKKVNIIDLGVGNGLLVKEFIGHLQKRRILRKYIGIDLSKEMLEMATGNIREWFNNEVKIEVYIRDLAQDRFDDVILKNTDKDTINIVLLLGGTLYNFRDQNEILQNINHSIGFKSYFITTKKMDSEEARSFFDFSLSENKPRIISMPDDSNMLVTKLGFTPDIIEEFRRFDEIQHSRLFGFKPLMDISLKLRLGNIDTYIDLEKDEEIITCRVLHKNTMEAISDLTQNNFSLLEASTTEDEKYLLTISKVKQ